LAIKYKAMEKPKSSVSWISEGRDYEARTRAGIREFTRKTPNYREQIRWFEIKHKKSQFCPYGLLLLTSHFIT
jgi:hypothetical protein